MRGIGAAGFYPYYKRFLSTPQAKICNIRGPSRATTQIGSATVRERSSSRGVIWAPVCQSTAPLRSRLRILSPCIREAPPKPQSGYRVAQRRRAGSDPCLIRASSVVLKSFLVVYFPRRSNRNVPVVARTQVGFGRQVLCHSIELVRKDRGFASTLQPWPPFAVCPIGNGLFAPPPRPGVIVAGADRPDKRAAAERFRPAARRSVCS